jgi:hypothetical protein
MRALFLLLSISAAHADCLKENVTFAIPHGTSLSVASPGLASYHQVFRYGDICIGKEDRHFTVKRIAGLTLDGSSLVEQHLRSTKYEIDARSIRTSNG